MQDLGYGTTKASVQNHILPNEVELCKAIRALLITTHILTELNIYLSWSFSVHFGKKQPLKGLIKDPRVSPHKTNRMKLSACV